MSHLYNKKRKAEEAACAAEEEESEINWSPNSFFGPEASSTEIPMGDPGVGPSPGGAGISIPGDQPPTIGDKNPIETKRFSRTLFHYIDAFDVPIDRAQYKFNAVSEKWTDIQMMHRCVQIPYADLRASATKAEIYKPRYTQQPNGESQIVWISSEQHRTNNRRIEFITEHNHNEYYLQRKALVNVLRRHRERSISEQNTKPAASQFRLQAQHTCNQNRRQTTTRSNNGEKYLQLRFNLIRVTQ